MSKKDVIRIIEAYSNMEREIDFIKNAKRPKIEIDSEIRLLKSRQNKIFAALKQLPWMQKQSIWYFYIDKINWKQISRKIGCCESKCRDERNKGLENLAICTDY
jgi:DNA-directed RNA polymerase specialized sigma24 family protein